MSNVISLNTGPVGPGIQIAADAVLGAAVGNLREVVVIGFEADGSLYLAGSGGPVETLWLLERARHYLMTNADA